MSCKSKPFEQYEIDTIFVIPHSNLIVDSKACILLLRSVLLCLVVALIACQKGNDTPPAPQPRPAPQITGINPIYNITTGSTILITGENFGSDLSSITINLDSLTLDPASFAGQSLTFVIPENFLSSGSKEVILKVIVNGVTSNAYTITIKYALPGWRYVNKNFVIVNNRIPKFIHFYNDEVGLIFGRDLLASTNTGGSYWGGVWSYSHQGEAFHVYDDTEAWMDENYYDLITYNFSNNTGSYARLDTITTIPALTQRTITGAFVTQPSRGYILTGDGSIFKVKGSFAPQDIELEYQYSKYSPSSGFWAVSHYMQLKGLDEMNFMAMALPRENEVIKPAIIHKHNGVYTEYDLGPLLGQAWPMELHYVDANTAYFISTDLFLYKLDFAKKVWVKMNASGLATVCFLDANIGYGASMNIYGSDYENIYKTTDGGKTWTIDFPLDRQHRVTTLFAKNGKVWGFGISYSGTFLVKYNP